MAARRSTRQPKQRALPGFVYTDDAVDAIDRDPEAFSYAIGDDLQSPIAQPVTMPRQGPEKQDKDLPPRKKMRIDFSKNIVVTLGSNTTTVPEDLLRARSTRLTALIKDGENSGVKHIKQDAGPGLLSSESMLSTYLQLLTCNEVALGSEIEKGRPPEKLKMLLHLYVLCEAYEDHVSMNLVIPQVQETLHRIGYSKEAAEAIHNIYKHKGPGHPLRRLLVDYGCDFWSMSNYSSVQNDFLTEALAEFIRRRDESTNKAVRPPPAEAAKKYFVSE